MIVRCITRKAATLLLGLAILSTSSCVSPTAELETRAPVSAKFDNLPIMFPTWSPDGKRMALIELATDGETGGIGYVAVIDISTGTIVRLNNDDGLYSWPKWSPDGTLLAVHSNYEIWLVDTANGTMRYLIKGEGAAWSPDGKALAVFESPRSGGPLDNFQIVFVTLSGEKLGQVFAGAIDLQTETPPPLPTVAQGSFAGMDWSPEGQTIIYSVVYPNRYQADIFLVNVDGSGLRQLTTKGINKEPTWSPDGTKIAYISSNDFARYDLFVMTPIGNCHVRLTRNGHTRSPSWSPDSRRLSFQEASTLYVLDIHTILRDKNLDLKQCEEMH